jgi:hypothetical protein
MIGSIEFVRANFKWVLLEQASSNFTKVAKGT